MHVGFVTHYYDRQEGTGGYAVELVTRLAASHRVTLYAAGVRTPPPPGVTVVPVPAVTRRAYTTMVTFPGAFATVRQPHDVVHAQGWTAHDADVVTAHIVLAAWREVSRTHNVRAPLGEKLLGGWVARKETELLRRARAVIAPSRRARDDIAETSGRTEGVTVVPHGCDRDITLTPRAVARAKCGLDEHPFVAVYIGDARKGLRPAIAALVRAQEAHLLVLSGSPRAPYDDVAEQLGVSARVCWMPEGSTAADAFGAADVCLQPTIYDTFGMVVGEALALGIPVITSSRAGAAELIEHRRSGWLLNGVTSEETGGALLALLRDPRLRATLAEEGKQVAARYTWDDTARRTIEVYERVRRA